MPPKKRTKADGAKSPVRDVIGAGGEIHQRAGGDSPVMTTAQGAPIEDDNNSVRVGDRGPTLMSDHAFREKFFHFDHERIPERVVHARGYGAHGVFECHESLADITRASIFAEAGKKTETFTRFSTVAGKAGSFDLARDVRGFATKFYTDEGNWDLIGNNMPVFFIQDAIKFPDLVHAVKEEPDRGFPQAQSAHDTFWDFTSLMPESTHMTLWQMSDRAIPRSFRMMEGFGVHTFRFINDAGESSFVKFHWKPLQGMQSVVWNEAVKINGADPDFHRRDLFDAINAGDFPKWELGVQVFDEAFAESFDFDVLDATKLIPEELVPVRTVGTMTLNRVVDNVFAEIEQVAFMTQNVPPGIDFSNDPLLQGRTSPISTPSSSDSAAPTSASCPSTHHGAPSPTSSATGTCRWTPSPGGRLTSRTPSAARIVVRVRSGHRASSPSPRTSKASPGGCAARPSRTTTAKPASSTSARHRSSRSTSSSATPSSWASARSRPSGRGWSPTSAMSTRTSPRRSPRGWGCRCPRPPCLRSSRSPTCQRAPR